MDVEAAERIVSERIKLGRCVQCSEKLDRNRGDGPWWCLRCREDSRCVICGVKVGYARSRCDEHLPPLKPVTL